MKKLLNFFAWPEAELKFSLSLSKKERKKQTNKLTAAQSLRS
jgi:hypothetical protein